MSMKAASLKITGRRHLNPSHDLQFGRNQLINWCWTKNYSQIFEIRIDIQLTLDFLRAYDNTKLCVSEAVWRGFQLAAPPQQALRPCSLKHGPRQKISPLQYSNTLTLLHLLKFCKQYKSQPVWSYTLQIA